MTKSNVEDSLCDALDAAGNDYRQAVRMLDSISREIAGGSGGEQSFAQLQQIAAATRETETRVARLREEWMRFGQRPGERLQSVVRRQEDVLRDLIRSLDTAEQVARAARGPLLQTIDGTTRAQQMHAAYARTVRQAVQ